MKTRNKFYKSLALVLGLVIPFSTVLGCSKSEHPTLPDYSSVAKEYDFFAYTAPTEGVWDIDGEDVQVGPDQRTVEGYTTYKEAGFNVLLLTGTGGYDGETEWKDSECKRAMTAAVEAGIDRIIITDRRINNLIERKDSLLGEGRQYETEEQLKEEVKSILSTYINEESFYGVNLRDEPDYTYVKSFGWVYKAIKAAAKELGKEDIYIHMNLLPYDSVYSRFGAEFEYENMSDAYYGYVRKYLEYTEADRVSVDVYAFRNMGIAGAFYTTAQVYSKLGKELGVDITFCLQSYAMKSNYFRKVGKSEMLFELYSLMGFGFDDFAYYTYQQTAGAPIDSSFMNGDGTLTNIYYYGQEAMSNAQAMSDIILNYEFLGSKFYNVKVPNFDVSCYYSGPVGTVKILNEDGTTKNSNSSLNFDNSHEFTLLKGIEFDNDVVYVSELKDNVNDLYMYMVQNVIRPLNAQDGRTAEKVKVDFGAEYSFVAELKDGSLTYVPLEEGVYEKTLSAGHAVYLIPLK